MSSQVDDPQAEVPAAADAPSGGRRRALVGGAFLAVGLLIAGFAVWTTTHEDSGERKVGKLTASHLGDEATTTTSKGKGTTPTSPSSAPPTIADGGSATTTAPATSPGTKPTWPAAVSSRPPALGKQGQPPPTSVSKIDDGFYLWQDFYGWHLWQVGGSSDDKVTVTVDSPLAKQEGVGGDVQIDASTNAFTFSRGSADAEVVGVDFNPGYYAKTIVVSVDGKLRLHVGARRYRTPDYYGLSYSTANS
ncbi:MAG: hypothetical protein U0P45_11105 [Acidimicrobiales bacterium]